MKRFFGNIPTSILLIVNMTLSFFLMFNAISLIASLIDERRTMNCFSYSSTINIDCMSKSEEVIDVINHLLTYENDKISLQNVHVFLGDDVQNYVASIYFSNNSNVSIEMGETLQKRFTVFENDELTVNGVCVKKIKYLEDSNHTIPDNGILINWGMISDELKESIVNISLRNLGLTVLIESNEPIDSIVNDICMYADSKGLSALSFHKIKDKSFEDKWNDTFNLLFLSISFSFSFFANASAIEVWMQKRKKGLMIRSAFGFSTKQIVLLILKQIIKFSFVSFCLAIVIEILYCILLDVNYGINNYLSFIILMLGGVGIILLVLVYKAAKLMGSYSLIEEMKGD